MINDYIENFLYFKAYLLLEGEEMNTTMERQPNFYHLNQVRDLFLGGNFLIFRNLIQICLELVTWTECYL